MLSDNETLVNALAKRATEAERDVEAFKARLRSLSLFDNPQEAEGFYEAADGLQLYRSAFNLAWMGELGVAPKTILDVGAYDGGDAVRFKQAFPSAHVVAFEADPDRSDVVGQNVVPFKVEIVAQAAGDTDGTASWFQSEDRLNDTGHLGGQGSFFRHSESYRQRYQHIVQSETEITVPCLRLDTFCRQRAINDIDLLHVDVEGAEFQVLTGLGELRPTLIYVEAFSDDFGGWIGSRRAKDVHRLLASRGYILAGDFFSDRLYVTYQGYSAATNCGNIPR
jgi:FkbM family methyltransferase